MAKLFCLGWLNIAYENKSVYFKIVYIYFKIVYRLLNDIGLCDYEAWMPTDISEFNLHDCHIAVWTSD